MRARTISFGGGKGPWTRLGHGRVGRRFRGAEERAEREAGGWGLPTSRSHERDVEGSLELGSPAPPSLAGPMPLGSPAGELSSVPRLWQTAVQGLSTRVVKYV